MFRKFEFEYWDHFKLSYKKLHLMACKYVLGVNQLTPTTAVYAELGRYPLHLHRKTAIIKYLKRFESLSDDRLSYNYTSNFLLAMAMQFLEIIALPVRVFLTWLHGAPARYATEICDRGYYGNSGNFWFPVCRLTNCS